MKIANASDRLQFEETEEAPDTLMCFECDLPAKINEQGLIARGLESGAAGVHGGAHRAVIVSLAGRECEAVEDERLTDLAGY